MPSVFVGIRRLIPSSIVGIRRLIPTNNVCALSDTCIPVLLYFKYLEPQQMFTNTRTVPMVELER